MKNGSINKLVEMLLETELFNGFNLSKLNSIVSKSSMYFRSYQNDSIIISQGDEYSELLILVKGECISEITGYNGRIIQIGHLKALFIIGPATLLSENKVSPVKITAGRKHQSGTAEFIAIPEKDFNYLLSASLLFTRNLLNIVAKRANLLSQRISFLALNGIKGKFLSYIESLKNISPEEFTTLPVKLEDLADYFGVERPSLSRSIASLIKKGVIEKSRLEGRNAYKIRQLNNS